MTEAAYTGSNPGAPTIFEFKIRALAHRVPSSSLNERREPAGDLGSRVEPELVQDASDVAVDGALGDEQLRANLLVCEALSEQRRELRDDAGAGPEPRRLRGPKQLRPHARLAIARGEPAERGQQIRLSEPVVDAPSDLQRLCV